MGQAFLSTVLLMGGIMIVIAVATAVLAATFVDSGYGLQASDQAESLATAGVNDAFLQLARNNSISGSLNTSGYSSIIGQNNLSVSVSSSTLGRITVLSSATVSGRTRKISAVFSISSSTGQVVLISWQDVQ